MHDNIVTGCSHHALDFDAYTSSSAAWSNLIESCGLGPDGSGYGQGIFVEESASGNFIFNNTVRNNSNGIEVYSNVVGPVISNIFAANVVEKNTRYGITSGGVGNETKSTHAESNIFVANHASDNGMAAFEVNHGHVEKDYWVSNTASEGDEVWELKNGDLQSSANVSVFEP